MGRQAPVKQRQQQGAADKGKAASLAAPCWLSMTQCLPPIDSTVLNDVGHFQQTF